MEDWEMMIVNKKIGDMTKSELKDFIIELQEENSRYERINQKYKGVIDKAIEYINDNLIISSILDGKKYYTISDYSFDYRELLDILNEVTNNE